MLFQSLKNILGPKIVLAASLILSTFGVNNSGLNGESPLSISSLTYSLREVPKSSKKLETLNQRPHGENQSSWFPWILLGVTIVVAGYAYSRDPQGSSAKKKDPLIPRKYTSKGSSRTIRYRGFLNRYANHCFANALLVCLIHLPVFKEKVCRAAALNNKSNLVLKSLAALFIAINQDRRRLDAAAVEARKEDFCNEIAKSSPEIQIFYEKGGDSRSLFQILCQNLPSDLQYFSFTQEKTVACENCLSPGRQRISKRFVENPFMLDIQEDSYFKENSYFPPQTELRTCKTCGPKTPHRKQVALSYFPEVLAIRIGDTPGFYKEQVDPWLEIFFEKTEGGKQGYRFVGGVYNTNKGYEGAHSVAYVCKNGRDGERPFLCYNDTNVRKVSRGEIKGYPKLMFYVKDLSGSVVLDIGEEKQSEGSRDDNSEERSSEVDFFC